MKSILKYLFLLLFALASSCKKPSDDCRYIFIDPALFPYGYFKTGTWWIIQNDSTLVRDTIKVDSSVRYISNQCEGYLKAHYEECGSYCTVGGKSARIYFQPERDQVSTIIEDAELDYYIWPTVRLHDPYGPVQVLDSFEVNSHVFRDVLFFNYQGIYQSYIAKNVYWIKSFDATDSTSYSLVDFHIVQ